MDSVAGRVMRLWRCNLTAREMWLGGWLSLETLAHRRTGRTKGANGPSQASEPTCESHSTQVSEGSLTHAMQAMDLVEPHTSNPAFGVPWQNGPNKSILRTHLMSWLWLRETGSSAGALLQQARQARAVAPLSPR